MQKLKLIIGIFILVISIVALSRAYIPFTSIKNFCIDNCIDPNNSLEECGRWTRLYNCQDDEAQNNINKLSWCYNLDSGKCGWLGLRYFSPLLFLVPIVFIIISLAIIYGSVRT